MKCKYCSKNIDDDSKFCPFCGKNLSTTDSESSDSDITPPVIDTSSDEIPENQNTNKNDTKENRDKSSINLNAISKKKYSLLNLIELILGILFIIIGVANAFSTNLGIDYASFGADFYTYTYEGIYHIAELLLKIQNALGYIMLYLGFNLILKGLKK